MALSCSALPILQGASAGVVGILQGAECLLGGLDWNAPIVVVHYDPDELFGLEFGRGDHQAVAGGVLQDFWFTWHDRV